MDGVSSLLSIWQNSLTDALLITAEFCPGHLTGAIQILAEGLFQSQRCNQGFSNDVSHSYQAPIPEDVA